MDDANQVCRIEDQRRMVRHALLGMREEGLSYTAMLSKLQGMIDARGIQGVLFEDKRKPEIGRLLSPNYRASRELLNDYCIALWGITFDYFAFYRPALAPQWKEFFLAAGTSPSQVISEWAWDNRPDLWHLIPLNERDQTVIEAHREEA